MAAERGASGERGRSSRPPFVGLTGGIAAGKSEALAALERLGAATLSSDAVVHELLSTDELRDLIVARLGTEVAPGGRIDRGAVAATVFERPDDLAWLEQELWPRVGERIAAWRADQGAREPPPAAAVVEVPLLFETGMEAVFDATIAVVADDEMRRRRASGRGHRALESRTMRQLDQAEKGQRADFVIRNDGDLGDLQESLRGVLATIGA